MKKVASDKIVPISDPSLIEILANNNCPFVSLLSELIDNVVAELDICKTATVKITVGGKWVTDKINKQKKLDLKSGYILVEDNATGIARNRLAECLSLGVNAAKRSVSLHEHAMGMKIAIISLGNLEYLVTKDKSEEVGSRIENLKIGESIDVYDDETISNSGTIIKIKNLKSKVLRRKEDYKYFKDQLGARYSRVLEGTLDGRKLKISLNLVDEQGEILRDNTGLLSQWDIMPVKPYFQNNNPKLDKEFKDEDGKWAAHLLFGFAASPEELEQNGITAVSTKHPYHPWARAIDIVMHDRILCRLELKDLGEIKYGNATFAPYLGIITLRLGFVTSLNKDGVLDDDNWKELIAKIKEEIEPIIKKRIYKDKECLHDEAFYVEKIRKAQQEGEEKKVSLNYSAEGGDGHADLIVGDEMEVWEVKNEQANGLDVYQTLYYIDTCKDVKKDTGRLIAPSFSPGAIYTAEFLKKKRGVDVKLKTFEQMGINDDVIQE